MIGEAGAEALKGLVNLTSLDLAGNEIGTKGGRRGSGAAANGEPCETGCGASAERRPYSKNGVAFPVVIIEV
jgi:hypothetical protein